MQLCFLGMTSAIKITETPTCTTLNQGWILDFRPGSKSQKAAPKHCTIFVMSFAQYMALKKGSLPLSLFTLHQKRAPIFYACYTKILLAESNLDFYFVWKFASAWKSISHCKLFEVFLFYIVLCLHIKVGKGPLCPIFLLCFEHHMTCSRACDSRVVHQLLNKTVQKLSAKASKRGPATSLKIGDPRDDSLVRLP